MDAEGMREILMGRVACETQARLKIMTARLYSGTNAHDRVIISTQHVVYCGSKTKEALRRSRKCEQLERLRVGILSSKIWLTGE